MSEQERGRGKEHTKTMSECDSGKLGSVRGGNGTVRFMESDISRLHARGVITAPPPSQADDVTMASPDPPSTVFGSCSENLASPETSYQRAFSSMSLLPRGWNPRIPPDGLSYEERSSQILETLREEGIISRAANRRLGASLLRPRRVSGNSPISKTPSYKTSPNVLPNTQPDDDRIQTRIRESLSLNNVQERKLAAYQEDLIRGVAERMRASELRRQRIIAKMADSRQAIFEKNAMRVKAVEKNRLKIRERKLQKLKRDDMRRKRILLRRRCSVQMGSAETTSTSPLDAIVGAGGSNHNR